MRNVRLMTARDFDAPPDRAQCEGALARARVYWLALTASCPTRERHRQRQHNTTSRRTGDVMGKPTEAIWLLASLVMMSQIITGVLMWWNARKGRARKTA